MIIPITNTILRAFYWLLITLEPFFNDALTVTGGRVIVLNFLVGSKMGRSFGPFCGFEFAGKFHVE